MELNEYQKRALETAIYPSDTKIVYPTLGITGEAGEVADKVKKVIRDNNGNFSEEKCLEIAKEVNPTKYFEFTKKTEKKVVTLSASLNYASWKTDLSTKLNTSS